MPLGSVVKEVVLAAGQSVDVMTDTEYEYPISRLGNRITVMATIDTGDPLVTLAVKFGQRNLLERGPINERQDAAGTGVNSPIYPDDVVTEGAALPGERMRVVFSNGSGAPRTIRVNVAINAPPMMRQ